LIATESFLLANGARALGLEREIGSIEAGKKADLTVLDLSGPHAQPASADLVSRMTLAEKVAQLSGVWGVDPEVGDMAPMLRDAMGPDLPWQEGSADGAPCNNRLDAFTEMRLAALVQKPRLGPDAMPAAQVLELATLGGARALGLEREIGSIEVGKKADLTVLDLSGPHAQPASADVVSRIVYSARAADVRHVIVDGKIVVRDGTLRTARPAEINREAEKCVRSLKRRAGLSAR
jgi:cytosine/adenosine deaminase-related metal-dependent hydrolase